MSDKQPFLTISLLSSGRIETIERCLASVAPIREKLAAEIVVVDTDKEHREDVHDVLEKYADRIIPFKWCDDFSAARNAGVDEAKGEWFLYIDDDEWFLDTEALTEFLTSPKEADYHWANIRIRNYKDPEQSLYSDTWVTRMFRMGKGIYFHGRMHELVKSTIGKPANLDALIGHTGYIFANYEERLAHARRNLEGLERLMREEPDEIRWVFQAMGEYESIFEEEKSISYSQKGYRLLRGKSGYEVALLRGVLAANEVRLLTRTERWEQALRAYRKYTVGERIGRVSRAQMELDAADASNRLGRGDEAIRHCRRYLEEYDRMAGKPVEETDEYLSFQGDTFRDANHDFIAAMLIALELSDGSWEAFDVYFDSVEWGSDRTKQYERTLLLAAFRQPYDRRFAKLAGRFWKIDRMRGMIQSIIRDGTTQGAADKDDARYWGLVRAIAEADLIDRIPWDLRILWADHSAKENGEKGIIPDAAERESFQDDYRHLFRIANPLLTDPRLWEIGIRRGAVLDERIREIPMERWRGCVEQFVREVEDVGFALRIAGALEDVYLGLPDEHYHCFLAGASEKLAVAAEAERQAAIHEERRAAQEAAQKEMKEIVGQLEKKVDDLVAAGMLDEADAVLKEIHKYTAMM